MKEQILFDSPEAATYRTDLKGWVSRGGVFYGDNPDSEKIARYSGCTHRPCDTCGRPAEKMYILCDECRMKKRGERWNALPKKKWDGKNPVCTFEGDEYFDSPDEAIESLMEDGMDPKGIKLVDTVPVYVKEIDPNEHYQDDLPEDFSFEEVAPKEVVEMFEKLNEVIRNTSGSHPLCYRPGNVGIDISEELAKILHENGE